MNISLNSFSNYSLSFLNDKGIGSLTEQQKKIALIFSTVMALFIICLAATQCCFQGKAQKKNQIDPKSILPKPANPPPKPLKVHDIEFLKKLAKFSRYTKDERDGNLEYKGILAYIDQVLDNPVFQKDPHAFMKKWKEDRGGSEEFRTIEDSAMLFFDSMVRQRVIK